MIIMNSAQKKKRGRILFGLAMFAILEILSVAGMFDRMPNGLAVEFAAFLVPYFIAGYDVLARAWHGITHKQPFDENLLMSIATIGAFALVFFPESNPHMAEGAAVMLFYQVGELFESYALGKTRQSISEMMDIAPEFANLIRDGKVERADPYDVGIGSHVICKPGERIPLDGVVIEGRSQLDTSALTGETIPRTVEPGVSVASGCLNVSGTITIETTSEFEDSTVSRILELVETASEKKARTENFITRFARYYTPIVVGLALVIALASSPLFGQSWSASVQSALIFLVVSCPCALVISVPLSFFGGIGAASRRGILVKGSSYLESLAQVDTVVFDKTGTLTNGTFGVVAVHAKEDIDPELLLSYAAHAEAYSNHPIALSVVKSYAGVIDWEQIHDVEERSGEGVAASVSMHKVLIGNERLMNSAGITAPNCKLVGSILHVALDDEYIGHIVIADLVKESSAEAIAGLHAAGVRQCVMLTGDRAEVAQAVAKQLGIDQYRAQLLPQDKVHEVEQLLDREEGGKLAFVGDGINDAPVLMRADVGIAMGGLGSDAAIEAADVVLMNDDPAQIASAMRIARKTRRIVYQNIGFALGVKIAIMILALPMIGISTMWMAVFGDVGVSVLAILNAMRCLRAR